MTGNELQDAISMGFKLAATNPNLVARTVAYAVTTTLFKFLFGVLLIVIGYLIARIWIKRRFPDKSRFTLWRDSAFSTMLITVLFWSGYFAFA